MNSRSSVTFTCLLKFQRKARATRGARVMMAGSVTANGAQPGTYLVQFSLSTISPSLSSLPITLSIDDRVSSSFSLPFRP